MSGIFGKVHVYAVPEEPPKKQQIKNNSEIVTNYHLLLSQNLSIFNSAYKSMFIEQKTLNSIYIKLTHTNTHAASNSNR